MITTKQIHSYKNGNGLVTIYQDGTKVREFEGIYKPDFPENIDIKITNYCDAGCAYCHEMSTKEGEHAKLGTMLSVLKTMPKGTEIAIGGGNPLAHPDLLKLLTKLKEWGLIANMTVNHFHLKRFQEIIYKLRKNNLIWGLGVSFNSGLAKSIPIKEYADKNTVFHLIAGVNAPQDMDTITSNIPEAKILILGYKTFGRGIVYNQLLSKRIQEIQDKWNQRIYNYLASKAIISFDNLAIKQLDVKRFFSQKGWERFYMGDDGQVSMYFDFVKEEYAKCSFEKKRFSLKANVREMFKSIN